MEATIQQLQPLALAVLWPFCRIAAAFATAPVFGEAMLPWRLRALISLILALALQPMLPAAPAIDALSLAGIGAIGEQILLGAMNRLCVPSDSRGAAVIRLGGLVANGAVDGGHQRPA